MSGASPHDHYQYDKVETPSSEQSVKCTCLMSSSKKNKLQKWGSVVESTSSFHLIHLLHDGWMVRWLNKVICFATYWLWIREALTAIVLLSLWSKPPPPLLEFKELPLWCSETAPMSDSEGEVQKTPVPALGWRRKTPVCCREAAPLVASQVSGWIKIV